MKKTKFLIGGSLVSLMSFGQINDAGISKVYLNRFALVNTESIITLEIKNEGSDTISSLIIDWNDGGSHIAQMDLEIPPGTSKIMNHPQKVTYSNVEQRQIKISILKVNGVGDLNEFNNSQVVSFNTLKSIPTKRVVFEEGTGTWCGNCVRGAVAMEFMHMYHPDFIGIAVHNEDPMVHPEYDYNMHLTAVSYPYANIDRAIINGDVNNQSFESYYNQRKDLLSPASIDAIVTGEDQEVSINASVTFVTNLSGINYRLSAVIIEDSVVGINEGYNQQNYYGIGGQYNSIPMVDVNGLDYNSLPTVLSYGTYKFNHVARAIIGSFSGINGSVPSTVSDGQVVTHTFNYTIPSASVRENMKVVIMLIDHQTGEILNANEFELNSMLGIKQQAQEDIALRVYPNPCDNVLKVQFNCKEKELQLFITDLSGRVVHENIISSNGGVQIIEIPISSIKSGSYLLTVRTSESSFSNHIEIK